MSHSGSISIRGLNLNKIVINIKKSASEQKADPNDLGIGDVCPVLCASRALPGCETTTTSSVSQNHVLEPAVLKVKQKFYASIIHSYAMPNPKRSWHKISICDPDDSRQYGLQSV